MPSSGLKSAAFDYARPQSLLEATRMLAASQGTVVVLGGGQSLLALRIAPADRLVDVGRLTELKDVTSTQQGLRIGAGVTHAEIEDGKIAGPAGDLMQRVAADIAYRAVRNHGTIGGSMALADPAADWPACLLALGASVRIAGAAGERTERIDEFLRGAYTTTLQHGEIITAFDVPTLLAGSRFGYVKVVRKSGAFANAIGCVVRPENGQPPRAVLGGTTTRPQLLPALGTLVSAAALPPEQAIRAAIAADLATSAPDTDAYQQRLYTATLLRAVKEAFA